MKSFLYESLPTRIVFGEGVIENIREEVENLGLKNVLIISTPGEHEVSIGRELAGNLGELSHGVYAKAVQHVPIESVTASVDYVNENKIDGLIAVGGGSSMGLAKANVLETQLPIIAIPTTYAGSEMTPIWGITEKGVKKTGKNLIVKPKTVLYDPALTTSLPATLSVTSGVNAIAHCVEALYSESANPITSLMAEDGIRALRKSLPKIIENPLDMEARSDALYGTWLGGTVLGTVGMALHHKLCHTLGGTFNLPHAETHTVVLPYVIAYNADHTPEAIQAISRAIGSDPQDVAGSLFDLIQSLGVPVSLKSIGLNEGDLDRAAELATKNPYYNPRPINRESIRNLLESAFHGKRPVSEQMTVK